MSTWNTIIKHFSYKKSSRLEHLYYVLDESGWDDLANEVYEETNGRIIGLFTDEVRGLIPLYNSATLKEDFKKDCKTVNSIIRKYERMVKRFEKKENSKVC